MCPLAHAAFIYFQKKVVFVMAGGFYNERCIYVPSSFIPVLLKEKILALEVLDDYIANEVGKIVCWYNSNYWAICVKFDIVLYNKV